MHGKKKVVIFIALLTVCVACVGYMLYWRRETEYRGANIDVYIDEIRDDEIIVKGMPYATEFFAEEYRIQINDALVIKDSKGGVFNIQQLKPGDILLFDYYGPRELKRGSLLNGKREYAYNFRISDEKLNLKFWRLE